MKSQRILFALALLPLIVLGLLALAGADEHVGVITGSAAPAYATALGAAWVGTWLAALAFSPGFAVAALICYGYRCWERRVSLS